MTPMTYEQGRQIIELLTEMRDELFRQGMAHRIDGYGSNYIATTEIK